MNYLKKTINEALRSKALGMSLIEILLVITIVAAGFVGLIRLYQKITNAQAVSETKSLLDTIQASVTSFKTDIGRYPQALDELITGPTDPQEKRRAQIPYVQSIVDRWGNQIEYKFDKEKNSIEIYSWGSNGPGSESGQIFPTV